MRENVIKLAELNEVTESGEDGLALAFAEEHAENLRYVAAWGQWFAYDGTRWARDDTLHTFDRVRGICREISAKVSARTVAAVEKLAKADRRLAATPAQWDSDPFAMAAAEASAAMTFDLRTGVGRAPDAADYITRAAACAAAPAGTPHPLWSAFLDRVTDNDTALRDFLQRYIGYCCTGSTIEHKFVFAYGTGANGKGTFINTIAGILGDYATVADMNTFIASNTERHPTDLAKLHGARLVVAQETPRGRRWDESKVKLLTGGDKISARFMRQDHFDFVPTFKLFIVGNHKPRLTSIDEAMRRRLLLVPFVVQIPAAERDPRLAEKLKAEWPAILRWCLDGCLEWQRIGLAAPETVVAATDSYFADQDNLQQWLDECTCDGGLFAFTRIAALFASWKAWCETRNLSPGSAALLSDTLVDRGYTKKRESNTGHRGFAKLSLKAE